MNGLARGAIFLSEKGIKSKISEIYLAIFFFTVDGAIKY